ncbi:MAG: hypothetical protein HYS39_00850, partial [Proteobacteria bacterium]|nr:hypothetical protein [Pseudomonadota bacterium]
LTLTIPITFLWTGFTALLIEHYTVLIEHQLPLQIMNFAALWWLMPRHFIPFLNTTTNIINAIQVLPTTIHSLFKPHQEHFAVTPKGKLNTKKLFIPSLLLLELLCWF